MKSLTALFIALAALAANVSVVAQQAPALETLRVQQNVYAIFGAGGNVTVQIGDEGVLLVDAGTAASADALIAEVRKLSTRPIRFLITDSTGTRYSLSCEETRSACNAGAADGAATLPSGFFKTITEPDQIRFVEGHGWGHGVGMCQWCAEKRAEDGLHHEDIVLAAFPTAVLVRAY